MKRRQITCGKCTGKGTVEEYPPHHSIPETVTCPECKGKRKIEVVVPEPADNLPVFTPEKGNAMIYQQYQRFKGARLLAAPAPSPGELKLTGADILGPFYLPGAPFRGARLCEGEPSLILTGRVLFASGMPAAHALLDWWQADEHGDYDEHDFSLRGKMRTNERGEYRLESVMPGAYKISETEHRCPHLHVQVTAVAGGKVLTTQLYWAGAEYDDVDHWFSPDRVVTPVDGKPGEFTFDFVVEP